MADWTRLSTWLTVMILLVAVVSVILFFVFHPGFEFLGEPLRRDLP